MSADEVLASSLWPWPDPLLKRDRSGLVLFVNAAFLQLYGGQMQDWCGKPLAGWPAPANVGAQRFETRIGDGLNENVFDWVESPMADGNALAIARNVTVFTALAAPTPKTAQPTPVPEVQRPTQAQTPEQHPEQHPVQRAPLDQPEASLKQAATGLSSEFADTLNKSEDEFANGDNTAANPAPQTAATAPPVAGQIMHETQAQIQAQAQTQVKEQVQEQEQMENYLQEPEMELVQLTPPPDQPATDPIAEPPENTRMMERRALPIEDSTNILGASWRDDVIAKAVGGASTSEETSDGVLPSGGDKASNGEALQILLAEDNAINALLTRTLLEAEGAVVDTVEDGALALEAVSKKQYDLIFMDMRMPNMDGLESTRKIRALGYERPIIALTANAFDDDRNACFDSGMNDFMTKPVSAEELSEMVVNWTKPEHQQKLAS